MDKLMSLVKSFARRHPPPHRLLGLDIGDRYIGVAVSDPTQTVAFAPLKQAVIRLPDDPLPAILTLKSVISKENIQGIVAGYPIDLDGVEGPQADKTILFLAQLKELGQVNQDLVLFSERYSTQSARFEGRRRKMGKRLNEKQWIDHAAAAFILQSYLDAADFYREYGMLDPEENL